MAKEKQQQQAQRKLPPQAPMPMNGQMQQQQQQVDPLKAMEMFEKIVRDKHNKVSDVKTPKAYIKRRPDGFDYVDEAFMRHQLNNYFPVWSWEVDDIEFLGSEWVVVRGHLSLSDSSVPRKFGSVGATRVQFKRDRKTGGAMTHTPENIVDIDKNVATANTNAFKRAVNRLCNIADDIYQKHIEDISLSEIQRQEVNVLLDKCKDTNLSSTILDGIEDLSINTHNYEKAKNKLETMIKEK